MGRKKKKNKRTQHKSGYTCIQNTTQGQSEEEKVHQDQGITSDQENFAEASGGRDEACYTCIQNTTQGQSEEEKVHQDQGITSDQENFAEASGGRDEACGPDTQLSDDSKDREQLSDDVEHFKGEIYNLADEFIRRTVLVKCWNFLIENLPVTEILDCLLEQNVFGSRTRVKIRDIREKCCTSDKIRELNESIWKRNSETYKHFKCAILKAGQVEINERLEQEERTAHGERKAQDGCVCSSTDAESCPVLQNLICRYNPESDSQPHRTGLKPEEFEKFSEAVLDFTDGHYILMVSKTRPLPNLAVIAKVPWLAVFDFDPKSRSDGLLAYMEETIERKHSLNIATWQDKLSIAEQHTSWVFMQGCNERKDTLVEKAFTEWRKRIEENVNLMIEELVNNGYKELSIIVLWPDDLEHRRSMKYLVNKLDVGTDLRIVVVKNENQDEKHLPCSDEYTSFQEICFSMGEFCSAIQCIFGNMDSAACSLVKYRLPTSNKCNDPKIGNKEANSLKEDLVVLYIDNETGIEMNIDELLEEKEKFLRGGTLPWSWWYNFQSCGGHVDVERDIKKKLVAHIKEKHIAVWKSGCVNLYHVPGSGGTTLAQRILWDLKDTVPCAQVLHRPDQYSQSSLVEKVKFLWDRTQLPVILLLDGEDEQKIETLEKRIKAYCCVIILRVRRCTLRPHLKTGDFYLKGTVSVPEARAIGLLYVEQCRPLPEDQNDNTSDLIKDLVDKVEKGKHHSVFEFGLTLYDYRYKGIRSYVKNYLFPNGDCSQEPLPWHKAILMLALAHYYGQISLPCQLFSNIIKTKGKSRRVLCYHYLPKEMKQLVVPNEKVSYMIRIGHYIIAKEILDQLLTPHRHEAFWDRPDSPFIYEDALQAIAKTACQFITEAGNVKRKVASESMKNILLTTFIFRESVSIGEEEEQTTRSIKTEFSRILLDVSHSSPYTDRFSILKQLTISFPKEAEFLAHLGRLYFKCRPDLEDEAEKCFTDALKVVEKDIYKEDFTKKSSTLRNIYDMFGNMHSARVMKTTGRHFGEMEVHMEDDNDSTDVIGILLQNVKQACNYFGRSREVAQPGDETGHGYINEIKIRIRFCDYMYQKKEFETIHELAIEDRTEIGAFVRDCYIKLDELFLEYSDVIDPNHLENKAMKNLLQTYSILFNNKTEDLLSKTDLDDIDTLKLRIVILKMKYSKLNSPGVIESVTDKNDIEFLVQDIENILSRICHQEKGEVPRKQADIYFREWLIAIRHKLFKRKDPIEEILKQVDIWYEKWKSQNARFYLFILKSLLGFGSSRVPGNTEILVECQDLKKEMIGLSKSMQRPKYPREWLGQYGGSIRCMVSGYRFIGKMENKRVQEPHKLEKLKGTICGPNDKPQTGYISIDMGHADRQHIKAFYVPVNNKMDGTMFKDRRVEFVLAFSMSHGYEAFNVKELEKLTCRNSRCRKMLELRSCDEFVCCQGCGEKNMSKYKSDKK